MCKSLAAYGCFWDKQTCIEINGICPEAYICLLFIPFPFFAPQYVRVFFCVLYFSLS